MLLFDIDQEPEIDQEQLDEQEEQKWRNADDWYKERYE